MTDSKKLDTSGAIVSIPIARSTLQPSLANASQHRVAPGLGTTMAAVGEAMVSTAQKRAFKGDGMGRFSPGIFVISMQLSSDKLIFRQSSWRQIPCGG